MSSPYFRRVEYLESTGTQYIDTNQYFQGNKLEIQTKLMILESPSAEMDLVSNYINTSVGRFSLITKPSPDTVQIFARDGSSSNVVCSVAYNLNELLNITTLIDTTNKTKTLTINGVSDTQSAPSSISNTSRKVHLFNRADNEFPFSGRVYFIRLIKDDVLWMNMLPVLDNNMVPCMYDTVSGQLFYNAGTGTFLYGDIIEPSNSKFLLSKKFSLMNNSFKKRPYYCEVEYLETTGTQYIETEYLTGADKFEVKARAYLNSAGAEEAIVNNQTGAGYGRFSVGLYTGDNVYAYSRYTTNDGNATVAYTTDAINDINVVYDVTNNTKTLTVNNVSDTVNKCTNISNNLHKLRVFAAYTNATPTVIAYFIGKLYYIQLIKNNVLWMDLIPVLDWSMKPAMYDKVSGKLYYNLGSGDDFSYGREIHEVEYLESTGTQYIDTGIKSGPNMRTKIKGAWTRFDSSSTKNRLFGSKTNDVNDRYFILASSTVFSFGYGGAHDVSFSTQLNTFYTCDFNYIENGSHKFKKDNNVYTYTGNPNTTIEMVLFGTKYEDNSVIPSETKIAYCQFIDNGTLVRDYLPAIDENGVGFMFDRVTHTIFDNAGTGAFKYPAKQLEYLESTDNSNKVFYIKTGVTVKTTTKWELVARFLSQGSVRPGYNGGYAGGNGRFDIGIDYELGKFITSIGVQTKTVDSDTNKHTFVLDGKNKVAYVDNVAVNTGSTFVIAYPKTNIVLFGRGQGNNPNGLDAANFANIAIYNSKIWDDTILVRNFIPAYKDGIAGMWDKANNVFYENQGTGTFAVGKIIENDYE